MKWNRSPAFPANPATVPPLTWIDEHGTYPGESPDSESPEQRKERIAAAVAAGMIRPDSINLIAANCLSCHTVPNEELVNAGQHPAGSDFELVAWSQGEVRHNLFWNDAELNAEASVERRRVFYVVGYATDLEFSMRALALSTQPGIYREAMSSRIGDALGQLRSINERINSPEVSAMIEAAASAGAAEPDATALNNAADTISNSIDAFANNQDGSALAGLDSLLPAENHVSEKY